MEKWMQKLLTDEDKEMLLQYVECLSDNNDNKSNDALDLAMANKGAERGSYYRWLLEGFVLIHCNYSCWDCSINNLKWSVQNSCFLISFYDQRVTLEKFGKCSTCYRNATPS